jgi:(p)ppGpp synthase/HD superfamily hydrolase
MKEALNSALAAREVVLPAKKRAEPAPLPVPVAVPGERLADALAFAIRKHGDQLRKGTAIPYVTHLMAVSALVGESGGEEDEMIAALLHDVVEDAGGAPVLEEIRSRFGNPVADIVAGCTDDDSGGEKAPWLQRKQAYLAHLLGAPLPMLRVSCADKVHNARAIQRDLRDHGPSVFQRFKADREGTLWYYRSLARIYAALVQDTPDLDPGFRSLIRELRETVAGLEG